MSKSTQSEAKIESAAQQAMAVLAQAAEMATKSIAAAAASATAVIATAVTEAAKLQNAHLSTMATDHDLLVTLNTEMKGIKEDIKNLRDEQVEKVSDHETRINTLETSNIRQVVAISVGALWLAALTAMLIWHLFQVPVG
jgi:hypothetical protein